MFSFPEQANAVFEAIDNAYRQATIAAGVSRIPRILLKQTFEDIIGSKKLQSDDEGSSGTRSSVHEITVEPAVTPAWP